MSLKAYVFTEKDPEDPNYRYDFVVLANNIKEAKKILAIEGNVGILINETVDEWIKNGNVEITVYKKPELIMTRVIDEDEFFCKRCSGTGTYIENMACMKQIHYCDCGHGHVLRKMDKKKKQLKCDCTFCQQK